MDTTFNSHFLALLQLIENPAQELMILQPYLRIIAESQVYEKLAEVSRLLLQFGILQEHQILQDDRVDDGSQVNQLLLKLLFVPV